MAQNYGTKITTLDFSNMSGGINTTDPATDIGVNQVQYSLNAYFTNKGFGRCFGLTGLKNTETFATTRGYGIHVYEKSDGTEILLTVSGQKLYSINETTGLSTELYDFGAVGEAVFANYMGMCFVCNGTKLVKYDGTTAYQVGIGSPAGVTAAAAAGGTLPAGVYQIYVGYSRKVSGANVLYGAGQLVASVTLSGGNGSIALSAFLNSADPQVNNKVVWMTDANGGTFYVFHETGNNTTTSFTISSVADRDDTRQYDVLAAFNFVPVTPKSLFVADNKLWYLSGNQAFFSLRAGTVYDLEKFDTGADGNVLTFPYQLDGGFSLNGNLCFNTTSGIIVVPNADISQRYSIKGAPYYFKYFRTVDIWNNLAIGVTADGVKIFDGDKFVSINITRDIKAAIKTCYSASNSTLVPCGKVVRNTAVDRTEYCLSFVDNNISGTLNNRTWVLDLDSLDLTSADQYNTQWEQWQNGFQYVTQNKAGTIYCLQSKVAASNVIKFSSDSSADKWIYNESGAWLSALTLRKLHIITGEKIPDLLGYCRWMYVHLYALAAANISVSVCIGDDASRKATKLFVRGEVSAPVFDESVFDESIFDYETAIKKKLKLNRTIKGNSVFVVIEQTADDIGLSCNRLFLTGTIKRTRFS